MAQRQQCVAEVTGEGAFRVHAFRLPSHVWPCLREDFGARSRDKSVERWGATAELLGRGHTFVVILDGRELGQARDLGVDRRVAAALWFPVRVGFPCEKK